MNDDVASRKTYRYLRIGIIAAVFLLAASVVLERTKVAPACWQTSISAYYYTPARAVFVGALMAIGMSLVVIKGSTPWEDVFLNVAGMLAPVVALVPIGNPGECWSIEPEPLPTVKNSTTGKLELAPWVERNIENNIEALLWAGVAALLDCGGHRRHRLRGRCPAGRAPGAVRPLEGAAAGHASSASSPSSRSSLSARRCSPSGTGSRRTPMAWLRTPCSVSSAPPRW